MTAAERLEARRRLIDDRRMWRAAVRTYGACIVLFVAVAAAGLALVMLLADPVP